MSIQKLERVMWRLRKNNPNNDTPRLTEVRKAIMYEIGTDERTYLKNVKALKQIGWLKRYTRHQLKITNKDLGE